MMGRVIATDVLVVGGGGAGFRAAIGAREAGVRVLLLSKGPLARCGATPMAGADFTLDGQSLHKLGFPGAPTDTYEKFFNDIVTQGYYLNNQKLVEQYIRTAPARLKELLDWGIKVLFSEERAIFTSGIALMDALLRQAKSVGVELFEDTMLFDLAMQEGKTAGALGLDIRTGEFIQFKTKAVVMATGGWHKAFWPNTGMRDLSGEGIAMAHRAGADIGNMEFITFCCNVLLSPPVWRGSIATYILSLLCGGELTNNAGETFLKKYDPYTVEKGTTMEWNKGFISFASMKEVREGQGTPNGGVYYGRGQVPWETFERIATSTIFPNWKYKAMNLVGLGRMLKENKPVEVGPAVEYFEGGIVVNEKLETTIEGLYAAGECTLGPFGANRVCSAITEMLVHGAEAGRNAGEYAKKAKVPWPEPQAFQRLQETAEQPLLRQKGLRPAQVRRQVQETAHRQLGPIRKQEELSDFIAFLDRVIKEELPQLAILSPSRIYNKEWIDAIELRNMVHLLQTAAISAMLRTESRGVHYREDYPYTDNDNWLQESIVKCEEGILKVFRRPAAITTLSPPQGRVPFLEMMKKMMEARSDIGGHH
ncbi:MAG: FAD-binding protein [Proteobacteria bacterium]|nr:FAD-binding protein [Pseudomonadota bacterium]